MNIIVGNEQQSILERLDIDVIKSVTGCYEANVLIDMFRTFFFNKMILDVTALKKYRDINSYKELISGLEAEKIIFYIPEKSSLCTAKFLSELVDLGIYNFTSNLEGIKYLIKHSNTYQEVAHIKKLVEQQSDVSATITNTTSSLKESVSINRKNNDSGTRIIGFRNVTSHAGATTLIYMLKKELTEVYGNESVLAIEINKNDFGVFIDKEMISVSKDNIYSVLRKAKKYKIILIDLNDFVDNSICSEVCYLLEPSIIKLNKLIRLNNNVFQRLKGRKLILNKSLLSEKEITSFEAEAKTKIFYNLPALNERKRNDILYDFLAKLDLIDIGEGKESSNKVFGLFRR